MKLAAYLRVIPEGSHEFIVEQLGFKGAQTHPLYTLDIICLCNGIKQCCSVLHILAVGHKVYACEHHLGISVLLQQAKVVLDIFKASGAQRSPCVGYYAIGTVPVAALLNLEMGSCKALTGGDKLLEFMLILQGTHCVVVALMQLFHKLHNSCPVL